jgi:hypothetical protein
MAACKKSQSGIGLSDKKLNPIKKDLSKIEISLLISIRFSAPENLK